MSNTGFNFIFTASLWSVHHLEHFISIETASRELTSSDLQVGATTLSGL